MMASFMSYFGARRDPKQATRDAIVGLRQQLQLLEKKEEYLQKKIEEELKKSPPAGTKTEAPKATATTTLPIACGELDAADSGTPIATPASPVPDDQG